MTFIMALFDMIQEKRGCAAFSHRFLRSPSALKQLRTS